MGPTPRRALDPFLEQDGGWAFGETLRPPSQPTRYPARKVSPSESSTSTPVSSCANAVTSVPYEIGTPSSRTHSARMRSMWFCVSARP